MNDVYGSGEKLGRNQIVTSEDQNVRGVKVVKVRVQGTEVDLIRQHGQG